MKHEQQSTGTSPRRTSLLRDAFVDCVRRTSAYRGVVDTKAHIGPSR